MGTVLHMEIPVRRERVAAEIRAELARQKRSQASLIEATGITKNTLRRRLDGTYPFYYEELEAISSFLGLPLSKIIERAREAA